MQIEDNVNHYIYSIHPSVLYCNTDDGTAVMLEDVKSRSSIISLWQLLLCRNIWQVHLRPRHQSRPHLSLMVFWQGHPQWQQPPPPPSQPYKQWHELRQEKWNVWLSRFIIHEIAESCVLSRPGCFMISSLDTMTMLLSSWQTFSRHRKIHEFVVIFPKLENCFANFTHKS